MRSVGPFGPPPRIIEKILFCGLPGCAAARFAFTRNRRATRGNKNLVAQALVLDGTRAKPGDRVHFESVPLETAQRADSRLCLLRLDSSGRTFVSHRARVEMRVSAPQAKCLRHGAYTVLINGTAAHPAFHVRSVVRPTFPFNAPLTHRWLDLRGRFKVSHPRVG